jgi:UDP-N-acetylmuramoyl-L-alanyl-D-glutamate--2,6-diaminopimelate ligase
MKLKKLLSGIEYTIINGNGNCEIKSINNNSNSECIDKNTLFICIEGFKFDSHNIADQIIQKGVGALLVCKDVEVSDKNVTVVRVANTRELFTKIALKLQGNPQKNMKIVGVTGTSGKTSTTIIFENILRNNGIKCGVIGTLGNRIGLEKVPVNITTVTTPDSLELSNIFKYMGDNHVENVVMEVTSHGLALDRVNSLKFEVGIFTNIGIEHLDFHKTIENYVNTKYTLFNIAKKAVINIDDEYGAILYKKLKRKPKLSISLNDKKAGLYAYNIDISPNGTYFDLKYKNTEYKKLFTNFVGTFSLYNILSATAAAIFMGIDINNAIKCYKNIDYIKGRFEPINNDKGINIIIEYAHTAEQFENVLKVAKKFTKNNLISLFGCGGDRDNSKRPLMGEMAAKYSDLVVVGEDNPRTEDPNIINAQIEIGIKKTNTPYKLFVNRRDAIEYALSIAKPGDTFIMMGKGPESYQEYENRRKEYFSEREIVEGHLGLRVANVNN